MLRNSILIISVIFNLIWGFSYVWGQRDTGRIFGCLAFLLMTIAHFTKSNKRWDDWAIAIINLVITGVIFMASQKYYGL